MWLRITSKDNSRRSVAPAFNSSLQTNRSQQPKTDLTVKPQLNNSLVIPLIGMKLLKANAWSSSDLQMRRKSDSSHRNRSVPVNLNRWRLITVRDIFASQLRQRIGSSTLLSLLLILAPCRLEGFLVDLRRYFKPLGMVRA